MTIKILQNCDDAHRQREGERHGLNPRPPAVKKKNYRQVSKMQATRFEKASKAGKKASNYKFGQELYLNCEL